jgi:hypothetical protein
MKIILLVSALLLSSFVLFSCKKDNPIPPEDQPQASLTLEDASCTEAWIKLSTVNISLPADVELYKDSSLAERINLATADTVLYVDSLLPNQLYSFHSIIQSSYQSISSNKLPLTTMNTTSHNFTWQTWTFGGQAGSCTLYDVAIINENDIWAVGEIYLNDSLGNAVRYNAVHWDGNNWEIERIPYYYQGQPFYNPIQSIFAFGINDIWFCGNGVIRWDGNQYNPVPIPTNVWGPYQMNKIWGKSSDDLYVVGNEGNIAHYQNGQWSRIESGTDLNINDIWGYTDNSGNNLILCAASNFGTNDQKKLLKIKDNTVDTVSWSPQRTLYTVWFNSIYKIYAAGSGVFTNYGNIWKEETSVPHYFTFRIRGNGLNDIYASGGYGYFAHFNGYTWKNIPEISLSGGDYESIATKRNTTCAVGYIGAKAVVALINK